MLGQAEAARHAGAEFKEAVSLLIRADEELIEAAIHDVRSAAAARARLRLVVLDEIGRLRRALDHGEQMRRFRAFNESLRLAEMIRDQLLRVLGPLPGALSDARTERWHSGWSGGFRVLTGQGALVGQLREEEGRLVGDIRRVVPVQGARPFAFEIDGVASELRHGGCRFSLAQPTGTEPVLSDTDLERLAAAGAEALQLPWGPHA